VNGKNVSYYFHRRFYLKCLAHGLDSNALDQLLTDVHGDFFMFGVHLSVYFAILKIFFVYFRMWVDSFKVVMLLLRIYLFCYFMLFDLCVRLPRSR